MKANKAIGKVRLAMERIASDMPLHAGLLARWRLSSDSVTTQTMSIAFRGGRFWLCVNPEFVEPLTMDEVAAVVCHELMHVLCGHVFRERQVTDNHTAMTIAMETVANDWVPLPLPGKPMLTSDYPMLSPSDDTPSRYDALKDTIPDTHIVVAIDDHEAWDQIRKSGDLAKLTANNDVAVVWSKLSAEQKTRVRLPRAAQDRLEAAGAMDGEGEDAIGKGRASVPWQKVLRRYVGKETQRRPVFGRVPRRFPHLVGVVPGKARQGGKPHIMAVIDSSGSITAQLLGAISAELAVMAKSFRVTVVECDTKVHAVYPYKPIESVHGRGGTDLRPPFETTFLRQHRPDLIVFCTDGCGPAPDVPPKMPVIWALTPSGRPPCGWGRVISMG